MNNPNPRHKSGGQHPGDPQRPAHDPNRDPQRPRHAPGEGSPRPQHDPRHPQNDPDQVVDSGR